MEEVKCVKSGKNQGHVGVSQQKGRKCSAAPSAVLYLMCACTCIQWVKTLAPHLLHFFPRILLLGEVQVRYLSAPSHLSLFQGHTRLFILTWGVTFEIAPFRADSAELKPQDEPRVKGTLPHLTWNC